MFLQAENHSPDVQQLVFASTYVGYIFKKRVESRDLMRTSVFILGIAPGFSQIVLRPRSKQADPEPPSVFTDRSYSAALQPQLPLASFTPFTILCSKNLKTSSALKLV
jgi:hypothetical protein